MKIRPFAFLVMLTATAGGLTASHASGSEIVEGIRDAKRILFLGDSITDAGHYISMVEARFRAEGIEPAPECINLGLPSETCSGLSEPDHPFPRPDVHERLERALEKTRPDVVVACYGMNDGIYYPFDEGRFAKYRAGIRDLVEKVHRAGATLVLMTPPAFDPVPMRKQNKLLPEEREKYAWFAIYEDYDAVLERYAEWVMTQYEPVEAVVDLHTPVNALLRKRRKSDPDYVMSGDGVHVNEEGHRVIATALLRSLGFDNPGAPASLPIYELVEKRQAILHAAWLSEVGHKRPGVAAGLPLEEARREAAPFDAALATAGTAGRGSAGFEAFVRALPGSERPVRLFNGVDLSGWDGDERFWSVDSRVIVGENAGTVPSSTYLFTRNRYREFRLLVEVKQTVSPQHSTMHSAVAALGERFEDSGGNAHGFRGPLLMFCHDWGIWDAYRRNRVEPAGHGGQLQIPSERTGDWNLVEILVIGNRIRFANNGERVFDFTDEPAMLQASPLGLQLHANPRPQHYEFRGLVLTENPEDRMVTVAD